MKKRIEELFDGLSAEENGMLIGELNEEISKESLARIEKRVIEKTKERRGAETAGTAEAAEAEEKSGKAGKAGKGEKNRKALTLRLFAVAAVIAATALLFAVIFQVFMKKPEEPSGKPAEGTTETAEKPTEGTAGSAEEELFFSDGLGFVLNSDGVSYALAKVEESVGETVVIPGTVNGLPVTGISQNAFKDSSAVSLVIGRNVDQIAPDCLQNSNINCIVVSAANTQFMTVGRNVVDGVNNSVQIGFDGIPEGVESIGEHAYEGRAALKSISIPASVRQISERAFAGCTALTEVIMTDGLKSIGTAAFENCVSLLNIVLPKGLETVSAGAFRNCTGLKTVYIPKTVTAIAPNAFEGCTALKEICFEGSEDRWAEISADRTNSGNGNSLSGMNVVCEGENGQKEETKRSPFRPGSYLRVNIKDDYWELRLTQSGEWFIFSFGFSSSLPVLHGNYTVDGQILTCGEYVFEEISDGVLKLLPPSDGEDGERPIQTGALFEIDEEYVMPQEEKGARSFVREKGGFGGSFTITLMDDGTFSYYEGMLSSYIGAGNYTEKDGKVTLTETRSFYNVDSQEASVREVNYCFRIDGEDLIYLKEESYGFTYLTPDDGDRFIRFP